MRGSAGVPGRGDGEGVRPFFRIESHEGELPALVALPAIFQQDLGLQHVHVGEMVTRLDGAPNPAPLADLAAQHQHGRDHPRRQQETHHPAQRLGPRGKVHQHHRVEHQRQIGHGDQRVCLGKEPVGKPLDQRQGNQQHDRIKRPFAHRFGGAAQFAEKLLHSAQAGRVRSWSASTARHPAQVDQPVWPIRRHPVQHRGDQAGDTQPLVQPVGFVQPAEPGFQPDRAQRQHHGHAHGTHAHDAGILDQQIADGDKAPRGRQRRIGQHPQGRQAKQDAPQRQFDFSEHDLVRFESGVQKKDGGSTNAHGQIRRLPTAKGRRPAQLHVAHTLGREY